MRVVVLLEVIDVGQQHGEGPPQAARPLDLVGERPHEMPSVIQPGEPVGDGEALQLALALALPHAGHQVLEHLRQLAHLAPTARRELDRVVPGGHLGRHAGETSERPRDRKSTRLNSSHLVISYAVFCLKKKKQHEYYSSPSLPRT